MRRSQYNGLWLLGTVVRVAGHHYEIKFFGGYKPNEWATADELLPQSALEDASETHCESKTATSPPAKRNKCSSVVKPQKILSIHSKTIDGRKARTRSGGRRRRKRNTRNNNSKKFDESIKNASEL